MVKSGAGECRLMKLNKEIQKECMNFAESYGMGFGGQDKNSLVKEETNRKAQLPSYLISLDSWPNFTIAAGGSHHHRPPSSSTPCRTCIWPLTGYQSLAGESRLQTRGWGQRPVMDQNLISLAQCNDAFRFLIPWLVAVLQVLPPLEIHPAILQTFLLATSIYCFASTAYTKLNSHQTTNNSAQLFGLIAFISGSLSSALLVYIIVPPLILCIILISWGGFLSILLVHQHVPLDNMETYRKVLQKIRNIKIPEKISSLWSKNQLGLPRGG
ncbi:hypothetical protein Patl1_29350 [Pistacia atlantica]|uniref:Uncharacterized protein n=1 Tax=Pistacia atlantica TaxID=434234 RepID=A0ACC1A978_9ROSI|nr:hypothetical protein Patl1_29350 [Pistacia atlantica]